MNTIIYVRFSPRADDSESIQAQAVDLSVWCEAHGHLVSLICFDPAVSGTVPMFSRPGLATALAELRAGDLLVVRNLNRSARGVLIGLAIEAEVERIGARLAVLEEGGVQKWKEEDPNSWLARVIKYAIAEVQRIEGNKRTSRRMLHHQANGRAMGGDPPYGWRKVGCLKAGDDQTTLVEDPGEQSVRDSMRHMVAAGYTDAEIAKVFAKKRWTPRSGTVWHLTTIRRIRQKL